MEWTGFCPIEKILNNKQLNYPAHKYEGVNRMKTMWFCPFVFTGITYNDFGQRSRVDYGTTAEGSSVRSFVVGR